MEQSMEQPMEQPMEAYLSEKQFYDMSNDESDQTDYDVLQDGTHRYPQRICKPSKGITVDVLPRTYTTNDSLVKIGLPGAVRELWRAAMRI